ncbi:hypothetical protein UFOVP1382_48 [uncultured Caudovirales phage]|uniref:Uncharacterized protein n=1 Tax=uncultured Caudovirales phage TaxID=2100421 RepID=A0A6J5S4G3_9CAUD|nr:hypothetical protein UFOVP1382_48 [uncultured Caudovirales phage]
MHLKLAVSSVLSSDDAGAGELGTIATPLVKEATSSMYEGSTRTYRVASGVSNQGLDLAGLAEVRYVAIKSDVTVTVRFNGTESITIKPPTDFEFGWLLVNTNGITAIDVSNASGDLATLTVQLGGDVT